MKSTELLLLNRVANTIISKTLDKAPKLIYCIQVAERTLRPEQKMYVRKVVVDSINQSIGA